MEAFSAEVAGATEESSVVASLLAGTTRSLSWTAVVDWPSHGGRWGSRSARWRWWSRRG